MFAPKGSKTPVLMLVSSAIVEIILGLNCGSEKIHFIPLSLITSCMSAICLAPGKTSVFNVSAPAALTPNLYSKYW